MYMYIMSVIDDRYGNSCFDIFFLCNYFSAQELYSLPFGANRQIGYDIKPWSLSLLLHIIHAGYSDTWDAGEILRTGEGRVNIYLIVY